MKFYVYILECSDGTYYTGVTNDLGRRFMEHQEGMIETCYTFERRPLKLSYAEEFKYINDAIAREKQIKGWSHAKKEALIIRNYSLLKKLSKCHSHKK